MANNKSKTSKKTTDFLKKKLADKDALNDAIKNGQSIEKITRERGITLVQPL